MNFTRFGKYGLVGLIALCATAQDTRAADENVLVFGATGSLGSMIVEQLLASGREVTAFVRPSSNRERLADMDVAYAVGDLKNADEVLAAASQAKFDVIIDASAKRDHIDDEFYNIAMRNMVEAAQKQNIKQIIINSSVFPESSEDKLPDYQVADEKKDMYAQIKREKIEAEEILIESGIAYTIIRNYLLSLKADDAMPATGRGELTRDLTALGKIARPDLARLVVSCVGNQDCLNVTFNALDPSTLITP